MRDARRRVAPMSREVTGVRRAGRVQQRRPWTWSRESCLNLTLLKRCFKKFKDDNKQNCASLSAARRAVATSADAIEAVQESADARIYRL